MIHLRQLILTLITALVLMVPAGFANALDNSGKSEQMGEQMAMATFAGGCFWCMEYRFEKVPGVNKVFSGYTGGSEDAPKYKQVAYGKTGHVEAIRIYYNPAVISYEGLLQVYWRMTDPTDNKGQFVDRGKQYRPVIFYHDARQKNIAKRSLAVLRRSLRFKKPITLAIEPASKFWLAEDYHQDFYKRQSIKFRNFRYSNPRGVFIKKIWGPDLKIDYSKYRPNSERWSF